MFSKIRNRAQAEQGFTLIELLVVILIIGILAAIAIPSFLNQRTKGQDVCAKSMLRTMQTAMETYYTDQNTYVAGTMTALNSIENQIPSAAGACGGTATNQPYTGAAAAAPASSACTAIAGGPSAQNDYCVGMTSTSGQVFALHRTGAGAIVRVCGANAGGSNAGGCPKGTW